MLNSKGSCLCFLTLLLSLLVTPRLYSEELDSWPREVTVSSGTVTIYQPQIESLKGNILKGRTAVAYHVSEGTAPVFGAVWFKAQVNIDREDRIVQYETLEITDTRFPEENKQLGEDFKRAVQQGVQKGVLTSSLDELTTALAAVEEERQQAAKLNNDPPDIIYKDEPAILVVIDGKIMLQKIENSEFQAVVNTPYPLFWEPESGNWFLNAADNVWYSAKSADGPWGYTDNTPDFLVKMVAARAAESKQKAENSDIEITVRNAPAIVVVHKPTELVVSEGKAEFAPLTADLLSMSNTDSNVFMDVKSQKYYLLISGRWYRASSMTGSWEFVEADELPATFADIPETSPYADVRVSVPGTDEAKEAVMDARIPQTATVKRETVDLDVVYDGRPEFKIIDGTDIQFAVNCSETVIRAGGQYYLVKDAVWYVSSSVTGPWNVSGHVPPGIDRVPPSSPVYNTKYVYVYNSTPDVVYVGYTPGYIGSYIYGPTLVYGTGYYYYPWITRYYYYPRPATWGFNVSYNSWTGWGFGMSWSSGPFRAGFYPGGGYHGSYWGGRRYYGPRGYRPSYNTIHINNVNINSSWNFKNLSNRNNIYRSSTQRANIRNTINSRSISHPDRQNIQNGMTHGQGGGAGMRAAAVNSRPNNILTDTSGNVLRNNNGKWQQRSNGQWQNMVSPDKASAARSKIQRHSGYDRPSSIDRQHYSRQRASQRSYSYSRPGHSSHRGGGRHR